MKNEKEKIRAIVYDTNEEATTHIARLIADLIKERNAKGKTVTLGLVAGPSVINLYSTLVKIHREEKISFEGVVTFNVDEYYPIRPDQLQSSTWFMHEHLFRHVDIKPENIHIPEGTMAPDRMEDACRDYERAIGSAGGIDLLLTVLGYKGHIGLNDPGLPPETRTRLVTLDHIMRHEAAGDFFGEENVPPQAFSIGLETILTARSILLLAFGEQKARIVKKMVEEDSAEHPAVHSLRNHRDISIICDRAAASYLTKIQTPWIKGAVRWDRRLLRRAVVWLALKKKKAILKLTEDDYSENDLYDLLDHYGSAYQANLEVFHDIQATITGWPGGKTGLPHGETSQKQKKPWQRGPFPKRCIIFSPHPDDDVISMGGTLIRLTDQGHEVHIAYQTDGGNAVFDHDALRFADFVTEFSSIFGIAQKEMEKIERHIGQFLKNKDPKDRDSEEVYKIKVLIRKTEAKAAGRACGVPEERLHFLNMPFYRDRHLKKREPGKEDIRLIADLLDRVKPHQVYAAGDLTDPHGTHIICFRAIEAAFKQLKTRPWYRDCTVWLYRGAWQEWEPEHIDMAVPLSPDELMRKRLAIFKHQSQKDLAMFPGPVDKREFWQRAEGRNRATARLYDSLGFAEYEAIEAFREYPLP
ncbi:MAG: glucosamine-6-phosphate deaminase [Spirochaetales bacterium]|nr:glucosamine-6-phosphate deaminase [Spirochaetales bacterium]